MLRMIDILNVLIKYRLDEYLFRNPSTRMIFRAASGFRSIFGVKHIEGSIGQRFRLALQELGPVFIKFGQILASRPDILPDHIIHELSMLRDSVKPFALLEAVEIIENNFQDKIENIFSDFDEIPIAAGSVAQVHFAKLPGGEEVAVKILRPNIKQIILQDIEMFRQTVSFIELYKSNLKQFKIQSIIDELAKSIMLELNLRDEAKSIEKFSESMQDCDYVRAPKVYFSTLDVLIMERMYGTPIDHVEELRLQNIDIDKLVLQGIEALMLQIFRNGFFHADQHPGNLWIQADGNRVYLDFGIMGEISEKDRKTLLGIIFHLYSKNYQKVTTAVVDAGWVKDILDIELFENDLSSISSLFVGRKQKDFSLGTAMNQLMRTFDKYDVNVPHQFTLLAKTILQIEGTSKRLAPNLDLQQVTVPILAKHFAKKF